MKNILSASEFSAGILKSDTSFLSKSITLVESTRHDHKRLADEIIEKCYPHSGKSIRIGITGAPGVGKSTFIEALGIHLTSLGKKIAVLAIDPSSKKSGGSILGDKTRMEKLSSQKNAFVRPSPSSGETGGTGVATRESIILCEAAGFEIIFVETVGVGQSETEVHSMVDFFLLLTIAGAGDELQGIKRGIMEMADLIVINKTDNQSIKTQITSLKSQISNALHLFPASESGWTPQVQTCSSTTAGGIENIWKNISSYFSLVYENGYFKQRRKEQLKYWFLETLERELKKNYYNNPGVKLLLKKAEKEVFSGKKSPTTAAKKILRNT